MESTLGEHLSVMVEVFDLVRRAMKPEATLWLNYGDCYATKPNGRSAAATKATGNDDRTFRDKPFSTVGPIFDINHKDGGSARHQQAAIGATGTRSHRRRRNAEAQRPLHDPEPAGHRAAGRGLVGPLEIVWGKPNPMPDSSGRYRPSTAHEKLFLLSKSAKCFYDSEAVRMPGSAGPEDAGRRTSRANWHTS
jgi:hypothetical protein